ncbi:hypothetical protein PENTCL1PPCAC_16334, partial [Pristionchus entomophagus]
SLLYGFDYDRRLLLHVTIGAQTILPIFNTLLIHPTVLFLINRRKGMHTDIRIGYVTTVVCYNIQATIFFGIRAHLLSPYGGIFFGGPLCREGRLSHAALLALTIECGFPFFIFLTVRLHQLVLRGSESPWIITTRLQLILFSVLLGIQLTNVFGFANSSVSKKA